MSAALQRRDEGCASDLTIDRWLLGEIPGSDEGRRLEEHVRRCAGCAARFKALRSLYGNRPPPTVQPPLPPLAAHQPAGVSAQAAVLQVVILRDGLLVGTEMFTPGHYTLGSGELCGLKLDELEPLHAAICLRGESVSFEALDGQVFVNGFRATACELRAIDEVAVGPYVLRARVIAERWRKAQLHAVETQSRQTTIAEPPTEQTAIQPTATQQVPVARSLRGPHALKLELFWSERRLDVEVFAKEPSAADRFGLRRAVPAEEGFLLQLDDGRELLVGPSAPLRYRVGALRCVASVVAVPPTVRARPLREWPWTVVGLAAALVLGAVVLDRYAAQLEPADDLVTRPLPQLTVHLVPKPPKAPTPPPAPTADPPSPTETVKATDAAVPPPRTRPPRVQPPAGLRAVSQLTRGDAFSALLAGIKGKSPRPGPSKSPSLIASLVGAAGPREVGLGLGAQSPIGIGRAGLRGAGELAVGSIGQTAVRGTVGRATSRAVTAPASIDRDAVAKVIADHVHEISSCYERAMIQSGGAFSGKMVVQWTINPQGLVSNAGVKQTDIRNVSFGACVLGALKLWNFPRPRGGSAVVSYPFHLNAVGS